MAQTNQTRMAAEDFLKLPETMTPTQLIDGEVIISPAPELLHQDAVLQLAKLLERLAPGGKVRISPVDVYLDDENVVQPDVLWTAEKSKCVPVEGKYLGGAPELVIEVLSPGTARLDRGKKFLLYEKYGVIEYWMADPVAKFVEVWQRDGEAFKRLGVFAPGEKFISTALGKEVDLTHLFD